MSFGQTEKDNVIVEVNSVVYELCGLFDFN